MAWRPRQSLDADLDCLAQNLCISVGYGHGGVNAAVAEQMNELQHVTTMYYHPAPAQLAQELFARMPAGRDWVVHLVNSGAEAIDLAVLVACAFTRNFELLTVRNSYPDLYRGAYGDRVDDYLDDVRRVIDSSANGAIAGVMIEPIQGYGGVIPTPPGYLRRAAQNARDAGGLFICDELQTGFGRTGEGLWAFEQDGVAPDVVVMSKDIGNGFPIAAMVARRDVAESMTQRKFLSTYGGNPICCAAARAVPQAIDDERLVDDARVVGDEFAQVLAQAASRFQAIGAVRGKGLMQGIELVLDSLACHDCEGVALNADEKPRLSRDLGDKRSLILRNHGLLTVGPTVADAVVAMYLLETSCMPLTTGTPRLCRHRCDHRRASGEPKPA